MCYNCGCGMLDNDMGKPKNITNKTIEEAAKSNSQSIEETKQHMMESLQKSMKQK